MKILMKSLGFNAGDALQQHAVSRLGAALGHWEDRLEGAVVRIVDANGPRGGVDKVCSIQVALPHRAYVVVTAAASDYYAAVDLAIHRACRATARAIGRLAQAKGRGDSWPLAAYE
ncbi:MAG: hypothetical protein HGA66_09160 [Holophaga sp.]|nr:hypothetical protein [Holophaga sp.]